MSDAKVLSAKESSAGFYGLMTAALLMGFGSLSLALNPPILKNAQTEAEISAALSQGLSYEAPAKVAWAKALSLVLGGGAIASSLGAVRMASPIHAEYSTPTLNKIADPVDPTTAAGLSDYQHAKESSSVVNKLTDLFADHPWLEDVIDIEGSMMDLLIIIGMPGKGKSCVASAIAILRKIVHQTPIYIFDADADVNVRKGTWAAGKIAGLTVEQSGSELAGDWGHLPYKQQHERMQKNVLEQLINEPAITTIYDELIRLGNNGFDAAEIANLYSDYTAFRKRGQKAIWLWHDDTKAGGGLDKLPKETALLGSLLDYAAVINFNAVAPGARSKGNKEKNSDRAMFKPAGKSYSKEHMEVITIPKLLYPPTLMSMLKGAAEHFDIRLSGYKDPGLAARKSEVRRKIERRFKGTEQGADGSFRSSLEAIFQSDLGRQYLNNPAPIAEVEIEDGMTLEGLPSRELFVEMLTYLEDPNRQDWVDEHGYFNLRRVMDNWGRKNNRFSSVEALRNFLATYNLSGLGEWGNETKTLWRSRYRSDDFK